MWCHRHNFIYWCHRQHKFQVSLKKQLKEEYYFVTWHFLLKLQTISWKSWHRLDTTWKRRQGLCKELDEKINLAVFAQISGFADFSRQWCFSWIRVTLNILYVAHAVDCFNCFIQNPRENYKRAGWKLVFVEDQFMSDWNWWNCERCFIEMRIYWRKERFSTESPFHWSGSLSEGVGATLRFLLLLGNLVDTLGCCRGQFFKRFF